MENTSEHNIYQAPGSDVADSQGVDSKPELVCYGASTAKFLALYIASFGFYGLYWFYQNWRLIGDRERYPVSPLLRTFFSVFWAYSCFSNINRLGQGHGLVVFPASVLAIAFIAASLVGRLNTPMGFLGLLGCIAFLPVNHVAEEINRLKVPGYKGNSRFSMWNWLLVVLGSILLALAFLGMFYEE